MAPPVHAAKVTLSCPLFSADFDPRNNARLLVGGGGGEGRSGVGNKIWLLDTSKRDEVSAAVELDLSRDEDSVTTLAVAPQASDDADSLTVLAGINSSVAEQKKNNNKHMRSFLFQAPRKVTKTDAITGEDENDKAEQGKSKEKSDSDEIIPGQGKLLSSASLFRAKKGTDPGDTYQRVLRLSPWRKPTDGSQQGNRIGAIATGLAPSSELVLFHVTASPTEADVMGRIRLENNEEVDDVDIIDLRNESDETKATDQFRFAYTNGADVVVGEISASTRSNAAPAVRPLCSIPLPKAGKAARPKFRALRFLTETSLILLKNAPDRGGSELVILDFSTVPSEPSGIYDEPMITHRKKLPSSMKIGLGLDVCPLGENTIGQQQFIVAASGSDNSIAVWTIEYGPKRGFDKIRPYTTLKDLHPFSMTKLSFSTFIPPAHPITPDVPPQKVKLVSVSMGNTVVVHTFPLAPFPPSSRTARYTLSLPGPAEFWELLIYTIALFFSFGIVIFAVWLYAEIRGAVPPVVGVQHWLPGGTSNSWAIEYVHPGLQKASYLDSMAPKGPGSTPDQDTIESLKSILERVHSSGFAPADLEVPSPQEVSVIVRCHDGQSAEQSVIVETASAHGENSESGNLRAWNDLSGADQDAWRQRLTDARRWVVSEGEAVLQGVLFSEACNQLAQTVKDEL